MKQNVKCNQCNLDFFKFLNQIKKTNNNFCSKSCAAKFNNRVYPKRSPESNCFNCNILCSSRNKFCKNCFLQSRKTKKIKVVKISIKQHIINLGKDKFINLFNNSKSKEEFATKIGFKKHKGNRISGSIIKQIKFYMKEWLGENIDFSVNLIDLKTDRARRNYLEKINGHICSICKNIQWMGKPIPIELDHIDGNCNNNTEENLRLVCPNCHAQTPTYKGKNIGKVYGDRKKKYLKHPIKKYRNKNK